MAQFHTHRRPAITSFMSVTWLLLALASPWSASWAQDAAGMVTAIDGDARLVRNGQTLKVTTAMAVQTDDKLVTEREANLTVTFADNSRLLVGASTTIVINQGLIGGANSGISRVGLLGGTLRSVVNLGLRRSAQGFEVRTPNAVMGVRGTEFEVAYIAGTPCPGFPDCLRYTDVGVYKGVVEVTNPLNPKAAPVTATAGYETTVPCEEPPATPSPLGMNEMLSPAYR
ncbi:MAG: FecR domain-containing protein [Candidatus Binataceae bacterium]